MKVRLDIQVPHDRLAAEAFAPTTLPHQPRAGAEDARELTPSAHDDQLPPSSSPDADVVREVAGRLGIDPRAVISARVVRSSLDARRGRRVPTWQLTVDAELSVAPKAPAPSANVRPIPPPLSRMSSPRARADAAPVIVVGAGPAGLFAAWHLAENGARVVLVERGKPVETRARDFGRFRGRGILDPESNLCFGEGGAGTYSDGKLTTRKHDPLVREVFERLVEVGAPARILIDAKPHIGTNLLFRMLMNLRRRLIELGVEIRFETRVEKLHLAPGNRVAGVDTSHGTLEAPRVILAVGHSARDTFTALLAQGVPMEAKPFALGVRAEHPQSLIDHAQYRAGPPRPRTLPPADYRLAHQEGARGVYSFCMCPGGMIVPTATEAETVVVNGMSTARRSTPFANSGVVVQVGVDDVAREMRADHALAGMEFQRKLERATYEAGGRNYFAPAMLASDLVAKRATGKLADTHFRPGLTPCDLAAVLPKFIIDGLRAGLARFDQTIHGYASSDANLIAVESRTSSPIQIPRDPGSLEVTQFPGLFVAGEGPGYAGGITSAAIDGLKVAHAVLVSMS